MNLEEIRKNAPDNTMEQIKKLCPIGTTHYKSDIYLNFYKDDGEFVHIWWDQWVRQYPSCLISGLGLSKINPYI